MTPSEFLIDSQTSGSEVMPVEEVGSVKRWGQSKNSQFIGLIDHLFFSGDG